MVQRNRTWQVPTPLLKAVPGLQFLCVLSAVLASSWAMPGIATAGIVLIGFAAIVTAIREQFSGSALPVAWISTLLVPISLALPRANSVAAYFDWYTAAICGLVAVTILLTSVRVLDRAVQTQWTWLGTAWAGAGSFVWLGASYLKNETLSFYLSLLLLLGLVIALKFLFRLSFAALQVINTLILLLVALPIADVAIHPPRAVEPPEVLKQYSSFDAAKKNPDAFRRWCRFMSQQWDGLCRSVLRSQVATAGTFQLNPNSRATFVQCDIRINSKGFRGKEIADVKGDTFRIVALGESSTFGFTINEGQKPWPEMLEEMINKERLFPRRVEVINAGCPGATLRDNLKSFDAAILPLQPDLLISYHGFNGFRLLDEAMPVQHAKSPPLYRERPLQLLADFEYRMKIIAFTQRQMPRSGQAPPTFSNLTETEYAQAYRELIARCQTNGIRLALAKFSMAANDATPREVMNHIQRLVVGGVNFHVRANTAHNELVTTLARQSPGVLLIDTQPGLDGHHDKFLDLVHPTERGDRQLAENIFAGIRDLLQTEK